MPAIKGWLKDLGLTDGDAIGSWTDVSGLGNHFTQGTAANKPTYKANILNGLGVGRFDGTADFLTGPNLMSGLAAGEGFIVVKTTVDPAASDFKCGLWHFGSGADTLYSYPNGVVYEQWGRTAEVTVGNPTPSLASWRLWNVSSASGAWTARLDGTQIFTTATNTVGWHTTPALGRGLGWGNYLDGDIAEVLIFDAVLSAVERAEWGYYFATRFGLTIAGATAPPPLQPRRGALQAVQRAASW